MLNKAKITTKKVAYINNLPKTPIRFLFAMSRQHKLFAFGTIAAVTFAPLFGNLNPYVLKRLIDGIIAAENSAEQIALFQVWGSVYVMFLALSFFFWRMSGFVGMEWVTRTIATSYSRLYEYVSHHSSEYFSDRFAGAVSNKISNAADGGGRMLDRSVWGWYPELISLVTAFVLLYTVDIYIALSFSGAVVVLAVINLYLVRRRRPHVVRYAAAASKLRGDGVDFLTNVTASRQYVRRGHEIGRVSSAAQDVKEKDVYQWRLSEWGLVLNNTAAVLLAAGIIFYLYILFPKGLITEGEVVLTLFALSRTTHIIISLGNMMNGFIRLYGEIQEGLETILLPHDIEDISGAKKLKVDEGLIGWNSVQFNFENTTVFKNFNLTIPAGQRVGLVGSSGAGKTTFVSLMLRQHDIPSGAITIDGQNISEVTQDSLRKNIAVVPQEPSLFHRSIKENIAYGKPGATKAEIVAVAKKAQAHEFISELSEGYDTLVGERGIKLSGGQKQRVAIARAMLKDAPILILDEATSALDSESEVAIQKALHRLMEGKTVVAVAHRLSTLREMDRILVLEKGEIIEDGDHETLMGAGGMYQRLWEHQAGGFVS